MRDWRGFPADAFVVVQNGGGDYLIIRPEPEGSTQLGETIYFWDHETGRTLANWIVREPRLARNRFQNLHDKCPELL
jgi:hypothetical protein